MSNVMSDILGIQKLVGTFFKFYVTSALLSYK
jgi:hypothetical protein